MNDELMVSAVCWEMDAAVSASFAHAVKVTEEFLFFCPECLVDVVASISTKKNFFFGHLNYTGQAVKMRSVKVILPCLLVIL
ncbi:hypothetical protein [Pseudomonas sp. S3_E11]